MITKRTAEALNKHLNSELLSSYLYVSMSAAASYMGLKGAANWFFVQAREEMIHVQKLYDYVLSQGERVILMPIDQPQTDFESLQDLFERTLEHEKTVSGLINELLNVAREENDHATSISLQWFVTEQVEEEESVRDILDRVKLAGNQGPGLFMIDSELATRVFVPPAPA